LSIKRLMTRQNYTSWPTWVLKVWYQKFQNRWVTDAKHHFIFPVSVSNKYTVDEGTGSCMILQIFLDRGWTTLDPNTGWETYCFEQNTLMASRWWQWLIDHHRSPVTSSQMLYGKLLGILRRTFLQSIKLSKLPVHALLFS
jgi:hypothetical protein